MELKQKIIIFFLVSIIIQDSIQQYTYKQNKIISRKKRYLNFPEGSNLVLTLSSLKEVLIKVPKGFRTVVECDVFFKLPSKSFKSYVKDLSMHSRHRREIFDEIAKAVNTFGFDGNACIKKMICEAQYLEPFKESSLFKQLLFTIFLDGAKDAAQYCRNDINLQCNVSLLGLIINHIYK